MTWLPLQKNQKIFIEILEEWLRGTRLEYPTAWRTYSHREMSAIERVAVLHRINASEVRDIWRTHTLMVYRHFVATAGWSERREWFRSSVRRNWYKNNIRKVTKWLERLTDDEAIATSEQSKDGMKVTKRSNERNFMRVDTGSAERRKYSVDIVDTFGEASHFGFRI